VRKLERAGAVPLDQVAADVRALAAELASALQPSA
jgi:hypothetical protein